MFAKSTLGALTALAALSFAAAGHAAASSNDDTISVTVRYGDLNLDNMVDAQVMMKRIRSAAHRVCSDVSDRFDLAMRGPKCIDTTVNNAVARLGAPIVTAMNSGHPQSIDVLLAEAER